MGQEIIDPEYNRGYSDGYSEGARGHMQRNMLLVVLPTSDDDTIARILDLIREVLASEGQQEASISVLTE